MTLTFELPALPNSVIARFDPRWKLAAIVYCIAAVVFLSAAAPLVAGVGVVFLLMLLGQLPWNWYVGRVQVLLPFLIGLLVFLPFVLHDGGAAWQFGPIRISLFGFLIACRVALKIVAILTLVLVLLATTPMAELLKAAHDLRVPGFLIQLTSLTWRYLFLVIEEFGRIRTALRLRGYRSRISLHNYRVVGHVTGTLLVRSAERAERVGQAMRCRGFSGRYRALVSFRTSWQDAFLFLSIITTMSSLLLWQWLLH